MEMIVVAGIGVWLLFAGVAFLIGVKKIEEEE